MSDTLLTDLHVKYIQNLGKVRNSLRKTTYCSLRWSQNKDDLTYHMTAHLRMNAVYWGVTALCIMKHKDALDAEETIEYVMSCWDEEAGTPRLPSSLPPFFVACPSADDRLTPRSSKVPSARTQVMTPTSYRRSAPSKSSQRTTPSYASTHRA